MTEKLSLKKLEIDLYGHEQFLPESDFRIDTAIFVADAIVWYSARPQGVILAAERH